MGNKLVLNNASTIYGNIDETNINRVKFSYEKTSFSPVIFNMVTKAGIVIKIIVLLTLLFIYFIIGATVVILYVIFYEKLYAMLFNKGGEKKHKSHYYYNWKNHHLNLNWEE